VEVKMAKRVHIGNSRRFEIFKRDFFMCQYCGNHPPSAVLEVDHILAVANGGFDDDSNLITSCFECNRGKAARKLSIVLQSLADKAALVYEREQQLLGYQRIIQAQEDRLEDEAFKVLDYLGLLREEDDGRYASKYQLSSVKRFLKILGYHEVFNAAEICIVKEIHNHCVFKYFCGVCWKKIKEAQNG
jgi:hypothetical protein